MMTDSQDMIVLRHMQKHKTITSMQAFDLYGCTRLSAKIYNLREAAYKIGMRWESGVNRFGNPCRWGVYYLEKTNKRGK